MDEPAQTPGVIETMAAAFTAALPFRPDDPRRGIADLVVAYARLVDEDRAMPHAIREMRTLLLFLLEIPAEEAGDVDDLRLRSARRRYEGIATL